MAKVKENQASGGFEDAIANGNAAERGEAVEVQRFKDEDDFVQIGGQLTYTKPEPGKAVRGILLSRQKRNGESLKKEGDFYYAIELTKPCKAYRGGGDDVQEIDAQPGDVVTVDERASVEGLRQLIEKVDRGARIEVIVRCTGPRQKSKNNPALSFWPHDVSHRILA